MRTTISSSPPRTPSRTPSSADASPTADQGNAGPLLFATAASPPTATCFRKQTTFTRSFSVRSRPTAEPATKACPCMKHVTGFENKSGSQRTSRAFARLQSAMLGVFATEQIRNHGSQHQELQGHGLKGASLLAACALSARADFCCLVMQGSGQLLDCHPLSAFATSARCPPAKCASTFSVSQLQASASRGPAVFSTAERR